MEDLPERQVPADSAEGRVITVMVLKHQDRFDHRTVVKAFVYDQLFPQGRKGVSVKEVAEVLGVSTDVVRDLMVDGELVGWKVRGRVVVSVDSVEEFLRANEWY